jgi:hypothetical protein
MEKAENKAGASTWLSDPPAGPNLGDVAFAGLLDLFPEPSSSFRGSCVREGKPGAGLDPCFPTLEELVAVADNAGWSANSERAGRNVRAHQAPSPDDTIVAYRHARKYKGVCTHEDPAPDVYRSQPGIAQPLSRSGVVSKDVSPWRQSASLADADEVSSYGVDEDPRGHINVAAYPKALLDKSVDVHLAAQALPQPLHLTQRPPHVGQVGDLHGVESVTDRLPNECFSSVVGRR